MRKNLTADESLDSCSNYSCNESLISSLVRFSTRNAFEKLLENSESRLSLDSHYMETKFTMQLLNFIFFFELTFFAINLFLKKFSSVKIVRNCLRISKFL